MLHQENKIVIVDYGLGNLFSLERVIRHLGSGVKISQEPTEIISASHLILPGVGAFGDGMRNLNERKLIRPIMDFIDSGRPLLGICLGMQLLMDSSEEFGLHQGLGFIKGNVARFSPPVRGGRFFKIPHIGWNRLYFPKFSNGNKQDLWNCSLLNGLPEGSYLYFVHSYFVTPINKNIIVAETEYGNNRYCSVLQRGNIFGCQFHPEVSGQVGLHILKEFLEIGRRDKLKNEERQDAFR